MCIGRIWTNTRLGPPSTPATQRELCAAPPHRQRGSKAPRSCAPLLVCSQRASLPQGVCWHPAALHWRWRWGAQCGRWGQLLPPSPCRRLHAQRNALLHADEAPPMRMFLDGWSSSQGAWPAWWAAGMHAAPHTPLGALPRQRPGVSGSDGLDTIARAADSNVSGGRCCSPLLPAALGRTAGAAELEAGSGPRRPTSTGAPAAVPAFRLQV